MRSGEQLATGALHTLTISFLVVSIMILATTNSVQALGQVQLEQDTVYKDDHTPISASEYN